jgi:hypothetical protein
VTFFLELVVRTIWRAFWSVLAYSMSENMVSSFCIKLLRFSLSMAMSETLAGLYVGALFCSVDYECSNAIEACGRTHKLQLRSFPGAVLQFTKIFQKVRVGISYG